MNPEHENKNLYKLISESFEGKMASSRKEEFNSILHENEDAFEEYLGQMQTEAMLHWHFGLAGKPETQKNCEIRRTIFFRPGEKIILSILSLAACVAIVIGAIFWKKTPTTEIQATIPKPVSAKLASVYAIY